jgi:hypothetical protein
MKRLRISGLVGLAKRVRQELAGPVSPERVAQLRWDIEDAVKTIEKMLRDKSVRAQDLPLPSKKAYQFLKGLNLNTIVTEGTSSVSRFAPESVSFRGLKSHFDSLLNRLAQVARSPVSRPSWPRRVEGAPPSNRGLEAHDTRGGDRQLEEVYEMIVSASESIEDEVRAQNVRPEQLRKPAREMRGWLAYFSQRENFDEYCAAVRRAAPVFRAAATWREGKALAVVHFRPLRGMYHVRGYPEGMLVHLPTPMISFDKALLRSVALIAFKKGGDRKLVHDAAAGEPYQKIASALELLGGAVTLARGLHHDLAVSFDRVNAEYFDGGLSRPHLVWSRTFAVRKFGHYDHAHDTVMVNMVLDRETVPALAVDFIVYHELLHKQMGVTWKSNRIAAHTPEFKEREQQFKQYEQAKVVLRKLASER